MNKPSPFVAALKIWFAGLIFGPVFLFILSFKHAIENSANGGFGIVFNLIFAWTGMMWGLLIYSLPIALLLWLALAMLYRFKQSKWAFLSSVSAVTLFLIAAFVSVLMRSFNEKWGILTYGFIVAYWLAAVLGVFWAFSWSKKGLRKLPDKPLDSGL